MANETLYDSSGTAPKGITDLSGLHSSLENLYANYGDGNEDLRKIVDFFDPESTSKTVYDLKTDIQGGFIIRHTDAEQSGGKVSVVDLYNNFYNDVSNNVGRPEVVSEAVSSFTTKCETLISGAIKENDEKPFSYERGVELSNDIKRIDIEINDCQKTINSKNEPRELKDIASQKIQALETERSEKVQELSRIYSGKEDVIEPKANSYIVDPVRDPSKMFESRPLASIAYNAFSDVHTGDAKLEVVKGFLTENADALKSIKIHYTDKDGVEKTSDIGTKFYSNAIKIINGDNPPDEKVSSIIRLYGDTFSGRNYPGLTEKEMPISVSLQKVLTQESFCRDFKVDSGTFKEMVSKLPEDKQRTLESHLERITSTGTDRKGNEIRQITGDIRLSITGKPESINDIIKSFSSEVRSIVGTATTDKAASEKLYNAINSFVEKPDLLCKARISIEMSQRDWQKTPDSVKDDLYKFLSKSPSEDIKDRLGDKFEEFKDAYHKNPEKAVSTYLIDHSDTKNDTAKDDQHDDTAKKDSKPDTERVRHNDQVDNDNNNKHSADKKEGGSGYMKDTFDAWNRLGDAKEEYRNATTREERDAALGKVLGCAARFIGSNIYETIAIRIMKAIIMAFDKTPKGDVEIKQIDLKDSDNKTIERVKMPDAVFESAGIDVKEIKDVTNNDNPDTRTNVVDRTFERELDKDGNVEKITSSETFKDGSTRTVEAEYKDDVIKMSVVETDKDGKENSIEATIKGKPDGGLEIEKVFKGDVDKKVTTDIDKDGNVRVEKTEVQNQDGTKTVTVEEHDKGIDKVTKTDYDNKGDVIKTIKEETFEDKSKTITTEEKLENGLTRTTIDKYDSKDNKIKSFQADGFKERMTDYMEQKADYSDVKNLFLDGKKGNLFSKDKVTTLVEAFKDFSKSELSKDSSPESKEETVKRLDSFYKDLKSEYGKYINENDFKDLTDFSEEFGQEFVDIVPTEVEPVVNLGDTTVSPAEVTTDALESVDNEGLLRSAFEKVVEIVENDLPNVDTAEKLVDTGVEAIAEDVELAGVEAGAAEAFGMEEAAAIPVL